MACEEIAAGDELGVKIPTGTLVANILVDRPLRKVQRNSIDTSSRNPKKTRPQLAERSRHS